MEHYQHIKISKTTLLIMSLIIASSFFAQQLTAFLRRALGDMIFESLVILFIAMFAGLFIMYRRVWHAHIIKFLLLVALVVLGLVSMNYIPITVERVHLIEFALLGWYATRDIIKKEAKTAGIIISCIFCVCIGILDEGIQGVLPYRVFEIRDIVLNVGGSIWGISLYLLHY